MSFKIYNSETGKWEIHASKIASTIKVLDLDKKFINENSNVESCLSEIKDDMKKLDDKVQYIYENGTIGDPDGGSGIGPKLTIIGDTEYTVTSDEKITITYSFTSNNKGDGSIKLTGKDNVDFIPISQGYNYKWTVGPFDSGTHYISLDVCDKQGFWSGPTVIKIVSGALELKDHFDHTKTYVPNQLIKIPYEIITPVIQTVSVEKKLGLDTTTVDEVTGNRIWEVTLPTRGVYKGFLTAYGANGAKSNTIEYTLVAADSTSLIVSTTMHDVNEIKLGQTLIIDYTNSKLDEYYYQTKYYHNNMDTPVDTVRSENGRNFWTVGNTLPMGEHKFKIVSTTLDGKYSASIELTVNVVAANFDPWPFYTEGLIAHFEASGKTNDSETTKAKWENKVANSAITCDLFGFNYASNGWIQVPAKSDLPQFKDAVQSNPETILRLSGKSHAIINYKPFENGIEAGMGFTFEIVYRTSNTGNPYAKVVSCKNQSTPYQGFEIDTEKASMNTHYGESTAVNFNEDTWIRQSFVIDRSNKSIRIYMNGILSGLTYIVDATGSKDNFLFKGDIILGAADKNATADYSIIKDIGNFGNADIRSIRIYNRALTDEQVLNNFVADIKDPDEQMTIRRLNALDAGFSSAIPTLTITPMQSLEDAGPNVTIVAHIDYNDPVTNKRLYLDNCDITWQGTSSLNYPVRNYTIMLKKNGLPYYQWAPDDSWLPEDRWTIKANYMDSSQGNNAGACKFIHEFFSRFNPYPQQKNPNTPGARSNPDCIPCQLIIGTERKGIYTFNIDRYSHNNYGLVTYGENGNINRNGAAVSYELNVNNGLSFWSNFADESKVLANWNTYARLEFKCRYSYRNNIKDNILVEGKYQEVLSHYENHTELLGLLDWLGSIPDTPQGRTQFQSELKYHFSIPHLIDYFIIAYSLGMVDNLGKNMVLTTFGIEEIYGTQCIIWYPSFYDCDSILGLDNLGHPNIGAGVEMANYETHNSKLWKFLIEDPKYYQEIVKRYTELRMTRIENGQELPPILSSEYIMSFFGTQIIDKIGHNLYNEDAELKYIREDAVDYAYLCAGNRRTYTEKWLKERFIFLDSLYGSMEYETDRIQLRSNIKGYLTIRIKTYSPQKTKILFSNSSSFVIKTTNKFNFVDLVSNEEVTNDNHNEIVINGASNIMEIEGLDALNMSTLLIGTARKLTNLNIKGNVMLTELALANNTYLQELNCSGCTSLGLDNVNGTPNNNKTLDLSNCPNLKSLLCNKTSITGIKLPSDGGVLETLNCSETAITNFSMSGQEYLKQLDLGSCANLSTFYVENCQGLETVNMPGSKLSSVILKDCGNLDYVDISRTKYLWNLDLSGCENLRVLKLANVSNAQLTDLVLTTSLNLEELDISGSTTIKYVTFGQYFDGVKTVNFNKLKVFTCANSVIKSIRYGRAAPYTDIMDLKDLPLTGVNFDGCKSLIEVRNITLNTYVDELNGPFIFNECSNLTSIQGEITISGHMKRTFYNCRSLTNLPTGSTSGNRLDLTGATYLNETFAYCRSLSLALATAIMSKVSSKLTNSWRVFYTCNNINPTTGAVTSGIQGEVPVDFFSQCTALTSLSEFFNDTKGISGGIHKDLFKPMAALTNCYMAFRATSVKGAPLNQPLDENTFYYNTNLSTVERMFSSTPMLFVPPENLFARNSALSSVYGMFSGCTAMTGTIPERIFANKPNLRYVGPFFSSSQVSGEIPRRLLDTNNGNINAIVDTESLFNGCSKITGSIPSFVSNTDKGFFDYSPNLTTVRYCFSNCVKLTGNIPPDILINNKLLTRVDGMFNGCSGLGSTDITAYIPPNIFKNKVQLTNVAYAFAGCTNLRGSIPEGLLNGCTAITDVSGMFLNCGNLVGQIPKRESTITYIPGPDGTTVPREDVTKYGIFDECKVLSTAREVFSGCINLNSEIPSTLFMAGYQLADITNLFYNCYRIYGPIPAKLFEKCTNLVTIDGAFRNCVNLCEYIIDEERPYAIPPTLFSKCVTIINAKNVFRMDGAGNPNSPKLKGAVPNTLFNTAGTNLKSIYGLFHACNEINGVIMSDTFESNTMLKECYEAFGETKITGVGSELFSTCAVIDDLRLTFDSCTELSGTTFNVRASSATKYARCFGFCTKLTNYTDLKSIGWAD